MTAAKPIRVLIVEDSPVASLLLQAIIARDPRLVVAAAVGSAEEALRRLDQVKPDVISMDIRLPGMDGIAATRRIMAQRPTPIVVIAASVEDETLNISMNALRAGALAVVEKPPGPASADYVGAAANICTQLVIMSEVSVIRQRLHEPPLSPAATWPLMPMRPIWRGSPRFLALGASTGGPAALAAVLGALPPDFPLPIMLVQHMGAPFMRGFATWLDGLLPQTVTVARDYEPPLPGRVYVAPGDHHMMVAKGVLRMRQDDPVDGQRPSATALFQSLAETSVGPGIGVLLTGMGSDGARGLAALRQAGSYTIAEHESSAVVYGMPGAAVALGGVMERLPLEAIAPRIVELIRPEALTAP